ncbi:hypothetical protein ACFYY1_39100 [Streptomyces sp. NPDC001890]|uniref:hypothetical protein n=1 Tax=Streptomyces sp. NPDC001890 TaxID=3364620 RepID=UPI0036CD7DE7
MPHPTVKPFVSESQAALNTVKELAPGADVIKVRANPNNWSQAEILTTYQWPRHEDESLVPLDDGRCPNDAPHTALTLGEFLTHWRQLPAVQFAAGNDAAFTYLIELTRPHWEHA